MSGRRNERAVGALLVAIALAGAVVAVSATLLDPAVGQAPRSLFRSSGGDVLFEHRAHVDRAEGCGDCHHELLRVDGMTTCNECHDDMEASDLEHAELVDIEAHRCTFCHAVDERTPDRCSSCHAAQADEGPRRVACGECHDDGMEADLLDHDELQEIEDHRCEGCHRPRGRGDALHRGCQRCHAADAPERFLDAEGKARCGACHLR